ncbi:lymphocyte antigen 6E-like [Asterias rubens]|uniref:lymphocyte antigen 6E-like n=1 Tax=Asterias rubens TaxID=7604 RepID=UPI0014559340|nr:lymphocyte antigen 6E-like [Asterias rubens]
MKAFYAVLLLAVCVARASALKCYTCTDCHLSGFLAIVENSAECSVFQGSCRKTVTGGVVSRGCATGVECEVTNLLAKCSKGAEDNCQICCDTDNCNGAVAAKGSLLGLALALVTAAFSRYL